MKGNKDLLTQVFLNLVKNASEAVSGKKAEIKIDLVISGPACAYPCRVAHGGQPADGI